MTFGSLLWYTIGPTIPDPLLRAPRFNEAVYTVRRKESILIQNEYPISAKLQSCLDPHVIIPRITQIALQPYDY